MLSIDWTPQEPATAPLQTLVVVLSSADAAAVAERLFGAATAQAAAAARFTGRSGEQFRFTREREGALQTVVLLSQAGGDLAFQGVGTCGPDVPGQRTYHLAWSFGEYLGSFELTYADEWRIALIYLGERSSWETENPDGLGDLFCSAAASPWSA